MNGLDHQQLPQGWSEGSPGGGDDSRAVPAAGAHPLAHDRDTAETPQYLQRGGIKSKLNKNKAKFDHHIIAGEMQQHCETEENSALQYCAPFHG